MSLPKMGGKKIVVAEITCEKLKKKVIRLQYFYNIFTTKTGNQLLLVKI